MSQHSSGLPVPETDDDPGPLVRPFAVTRGRAGIDRYDLDLLTLVVAVATPTESTELDHEYGAIVNLCQGRPLSVVELSAHLNLLVAAVKVLVSDLIQAGYVIHRSPINAQQRPDTHLIQAVLDGVRRL
ncbi:DUF742 domain-containing protein [Nocardia sp. NPDC050378]|uniref:DUF742 domain-containing protein n=1 Tax=Nocardia sp. NPDC050378 TaxID=3155400 RepID=UPI0033CB007C